MEGAQEMSEMNNHTPGPWNDVVCQRDVQHRKVFHVEISDVPVADWEMKANMNLIKAAPEMYEAIKEFVEHPKSIATPMVCAKVFAALAKAEGRS